MTSHMVRKAREPLAHTRHRSTPQDTSGPEQSRSLQSPTTTKIYTKRRDHRFAFYAHIHV
jgi:hypothetical protein